MSGRISSPQVPQTAARRHPETPSAIGKAWESKLDDVGAPPKAWKTTQLRLPAGSDASRRAQSLKGEDGLAPTQIYRNPANGTIALRSQTDGELDARIYVFDGSGKALWKIDVSDDGIATGGPAKASKPEHATPAKSSGWVK